MTAFSAYTDQQLIALLKQGEHPAFNEIHSRYFKILFRAAYNVLRDRDAAMDIAQEIFVWFWQHREQHQVRSIKGYLLTAVKYQVANHIRSGKVRDSFFDRMAAQQLSESFDEDTMAVRELKEIVEKFTTQLPDRCGEVFRLSRMEYLTNKEIAVKMGISEKTVEVQITNALKKLRTHLGNTNIWLGFFL